LSNGVAVSARFAREIAAQLPALLLDRFGFRDGIDRGHARGFRWVLSRGCSAGEAVGGEGVRLRRVG